MALASAAAPGVPAPSAALPDGRLATQASSRVAAGRMNLPRPLPKSAWPNPGTRPLPKSAWPLARPQRAEPPELAGAPPQPQDWPQDWPQPAAPPQCSVPQERPRAPALAPPRPAPQEGPRAPVYVLPRMADKSSASAGFGLEGEAISCIRSKAPPPLLCPRRPQALPVAAALEEESISCIRSKASPPLPAASKPRPLPTAASLPERSSAAPFEEDRALAETPHGASERTSAAPFEEVEEVEEEGERVEEPHEADERWHENAGPTTQARPPLPYPREPHPLPAGAGLPEATPEIPFEGGGASAEGPDGPFGLEAAEDLAPAQVKARVPLRASPDAQEAYPSWPSTQEPLSVPMDEDLPEGTSAAPLDGAGASAGRSLEASGRTVAALLEESGTTVGEPHEASRLARAPALTAEQANDRLLERASLTVQAGAPLASAHEPRPLPLEAALPGLAAAATVEGEGLASVQELARVQANDRLLERADSMASKLANGSSNGLSGLPVPQAANGQAHPVLRPLAGSSNGLWGQDAPQACPRAAGATLGLGDGPLGMLSSTFVGFNPLPSLNWNLPLASTVPLAPRGTATPGQQVPPPLPPPFGIQQQMTPQMLPQMPPQLAPQMAWQMASQPHQSWHPAVAQMQPRPGMVATGGVAAAAPVLAAAREGVGGQRSRSPRRRQGEGSTASDAQVASSPPLAEGERVLYWSDIHSQWVFTIVVAVKREQSGRIFAYDLECKPVADPSRVQKVPEALLKTLPKEWPSDVNANKLLNKAVKKSLRKKGAEALSNKAGASGAHLAQAAPKAEQQAKKEDDRQEHARTEIPPSPVFEDDCEEASAKVQAAETQATVAPPLAPPPPSSTPTDPAPPPPSSTPTESRPTDASVSMPPPKNTSTVCDAQVWEALEAAEAPQPTDVAAKSRSAPVSLKSRERSRSPSLPPERVTDGVQHKVGDKVQYYSELYAKWCTARVEAVHLDAVGAVASYDLDVKPKAAPSRVRRKPEGQPPAKKAEQDTSSTVTLSQPIFDVEAPPSGFAAGEEVRYWSASLGRWVRAKVKAAQRDPDGSTFTYELNVQQADLAPQEGPADGEGPQYAVGDKVEYYSESAKRWIGGVVKGLFLRSGALEYDLCCKKGADPKRVRPLRKRSKKSQ